MHAGNLSRSLVYCARTIRAQVAFALAIFASAAFGVEPKEHWAWQRLNDRPTSSNKSIDDFIQTKLKAAVLSFAPVASREQLLRRVTFDLTGLPPTREEIAEFAADQSPTAWERVIDRLLASRRYGERWGRHWLDL